MPRRFVPFVNGNYYHVYNKALSGINPLDNNKDNNRLIDLINYYRFSDHDKRFSAYHDLNIANKYEYISEIQFRNNKYVNIHAFSLMPNHYHFLLEQVQDQGIQIFMSKLINSYTKYFNAKNNRNSQLFLTQFKSKLIVEEEIFLHVCRYIMLNPLTSNLVKSFKELELYPYTSLVDYLDVHRSFICTELFDNYFTT